MIMLGFMIGVVVGGLAVVVFMPVLKALFAKLQNAVGK